MLSPSAFFEYVSRLRHTAFHRVDEQQYAVHHGQDTFHFAAEIGVSRRVNDIDLDTVVMHGGVFGEDRYPAFAFQSVAVHNAVRHRFAGAENPVLFEQLVDESGLAVVDVRYYGDVSYVLSFHYVYTSLKFYTNLFICLATSLPS